MEIVEDRARRDGVAAERRRHRLQAAEVLELAAAAFAEDAADERRDRDDVLELPLRRNLLQRRVLGRHLRRVGERVGDGSRVGAAYQIEIKKVFERRAFQWTAFNFGKIIPRLAS